MDLLTYDKPAHFDRWSWWVHLKTKMLFVVTNHWPEYDEQGKFSHLTIGILFKEMDEPEWRTEQQLEELREKGEVKCLMYRSEEQKKRDKF